MYTVHIQILPDRLHRAHILLYCCGYGKLEYPCGYLGGYSAAIECAVASVTVVAVAHRLKSTLEDTPSCSNHNGNCVI